MLSNGLRKISGRAAHFLRLLAGHAGEDAGINSALSRRPDSTRA